MKKQLFFISGVIVVAVVIALGASCTSGKCRDIYESRQIQTFSECVASGFRVEDTNPPRCYSYDGMVFVRQPGAFVLESPESEAVLSSPFLISGKVSSFIDRVEFQLINDDQEIIESGEIPLEKGATENVFSKRIVFAPQAEDEKGTLVVFERMADGERGIENTREIRFVAQDQNESESADTGLLTPEMRFDPLPDLQAQSQSMSSQMRLQVPFTPQAPLANWDPPFDEACEEASLLMAEYYLQGKALSAEVATEAITELTTWQAEHGYDIDITVQQLAAIAREYYGRNAAVYTEAEVTKENIMLLLDAGYPVIIPAAGQDLGNPYFSGEGPPYHMLVITGYDSEYFYTNDPGTKRGEGYQYDHDVLLESIHDWTGTKETIRTGERAMMVLGM